MASLKFRNNRVVEDPNFVQTLFNDRRLSPLWLVLRVWLGYKWLDAGWHKVADPAWVQTGEALQSFWARIVVVPADGRPAISFDWYRNFIQSMLDAEAYSWFAPLVAYGEVLVGILLILGAFTGIAAFFGAFMNWNFMMAGSASTNPLLFVVALGIMFAWKIAGYIGLDFFLLPALGTPWGRRKVVEPETAPAH